MAQYDGSIRIKTDITTKQAEVQLSTLQNRIVKTADTIESLRSKMDALKDTKIPTQEYKEISDQIEKAEQKFNKLLEKQEQMQREGKDNGVAWQRLNDQMDEVGNEIRYAKGELQDLVDTGKAFTLGSDTEEYAKLGQQLQYAENEMDVLVRKEEIQNLKIEEIKEGYKKLGNVAKSAFGSIGRIINKANSYVNSFARRIKEVAEKHLPFFRKQTEKTQNALSGFGSRLKNLALSLLIFNQIRKLFSGITSGIKEGFENLYNENERFQNSIDNLKASLTTLKNALAAAFAPIVEIAIPYIEKLINYMAQLMNMVGQFVAALMGKSTYTKAIKQQATATEDATEAIEDETDAMNKQLSPLDKLNNLSSQNNKNKADSGSGDSAGSGIMFEEVPIDSNISSIADKVKDILSQLFAPLKEAWEREGQFVMDSWKYALEEVWQLVKDIGRDFLTVWQQPETIDMLADILHIIGDIGLVVGNLARNFREAWNENATGLHILENIRDIFAVIIANIRHAADVTVEWSDKLDFSPILEAFERFTESLIPVADSLSGILTDFYEKVLLPLAKWTIEKGLPELLDVFTAFNEKVDWKALRDNLAEFWEHLEPFAETVGEGLIIFIEKVSNALADFLNSQEFKDFLVTLENWMDSVEPEDVANALEKIAEGLIGLKLALLGYSAIKGVSGVFETIKSFLSFFGVGGAGATTAKGIGEATTAISEFGSAIMDLAVPTAAAVGVGNVMIDKTLELAEANGVAAQEIENAKEEYGGLTGPLKLVKDGLKGLTLGMQGLPVSIEGSVGSADALSKAMEAIANGTIYTDEQMSKMEETWGFTADDMEMLRQEMMDTNPELRNLADSFTALNGASVETLEEINAGLKNIEEGIVPADNGTLYLTGRFGELTEATKVFFDNVATGATSLDDYKTTLDNVSNSTEEFGAKMSEAGENIGEGILNGMRNVNAEEVANEFFNTVQSGLAIAFDMHSPSKKMEPSGSNIILGVLEGFKSRFADFTTIISQLFTQISAKFTNGMNVVKSVWVNAWNALPNAVKGIINSILSMVSSFVSKISSAFSNISSLGSRIGGFGSSGNSMAVAALSNYDIPGYATGQVIPRTMKQHLAILGDNSQETEVVSPLSTIKQANKEAILEVLSQLGLSGGNGSNGDIVVQIDGREVFRATQKQAREYKKQTGNLAFT